jgi:hypothetical protein
MVAVPMMAGLDLRSRMGLRSRRCVRLARTGTRATTAKSCGRSAGCGTTDQDVASLILSGSIIEHGKPHGAWRWKIQGGCVDGHTASCVVEIEVGLLIVTVIDQRSPEGRDR